MQLETVQLDDRASRRFVVAAVAWGAVALVAGLLLALELLWWRGNPGAVLSFGRLRPIHTSTAVFAFVGNLAFAGIYYSGQRVLAVRLPSPVLAAIHFWCWQATLLAGVATLALGATQGKEYAEFEWPIDVLGAIALATFALHFGLMVARRRIERLHVSAWFYLAAIALFVPMFIVGNLALPASLLKSYSLFGGAADALVQWWFGEAAITFFVTLPALGMLYHFVPIATGRPIHSHRLAILHFWSLIALSVWAGPRYLLNTALPESAQVLGVAASIALAAPALGGLLNLAYGYRGVGDRMHSEPALKFFLGALIFYALVALEGMFLSLRPLSALLHGTDWVVAHSHAATMGFAGLVASGACYFLVPRLFGTRLRSTRAAHVHFYLAMLGLVVYTLSMWIAGATEGAMLSSQTHDGGLTYPSFVDSLIAVRALYLARLIGGVLFVSGFALMAWNLWATARSGRAEDTSVAEPDDLWQQPRAVAVFVSLPVLTAVGLLGLFVAAYHVNPIAAAALILVALTIGLGGVFATALSTSRSRWHPLVEARAGVFVALIIGALVAAAAFQVGPALAESRSAQSTEPPYSPLELEGRDVYVSEGCHACHTQMVRPFLWETARYGEISTVADSAHDHPFQWGSRRVGPDLARVGQRYSPGWHFAHTVDPRSTSPDSNMPSYAHLATEAVELADTPGKLSTLSRLGVPYSDARIASATEDARAQAEVVSRQIADEVGARVDPNSKLVALIAYLERLGGPGAAAEGGGE